MIYYKIVRLCNIRIATGRKMNVIIISSNKKRGKNMELLKIERIEKYYGSKLNLTKAIDGISMHVDKGEFVAIMGASGSGKTTLLNCISTIDRVTSGHIYLEGTDITKLRGKELNKFRREKLGFIFQDFNLIDTLTAYENIALALSIQKYSAKEIEKASYLENED